MNLEQANARLHRVTIRPKRAFLFLRATLPAKDGAGTKRYELRTGAPNTPEGIKIALAKAQQLESEIILEKFKWENWGRPAPEEAPPMERRKTIEDWTREFETNHWEITPRTRAKEQCFWNDYGSALQLLPPDEPLTYEVLRRIIVTTEPDSRNRLKLFIAFGAVARFAGLELPQAWRALKGNYQPKQRRIPTEQEIWEVWERLEGPWKNAYAILACYGLRNHELAKMTLEYPTITVWRDTKRKIERTVYPLAPDWAKKMNLDQPELQLPKINGATNRNNGSTVCHFFTREKIGFGAYALRDAYAIRGAVLGISPAVVAKWMGHSLQVHDRAYLRHLDKINFDQVWAALGNETGNGKPDS